MNHRESQTRQSVVDRLKRIFSDKMFIKTLLAIAIPVSLQTLIQSSLSMIDQMMIGQYGETAIAGVGLGGTISFILMISLGGIISGGGIYLAQYWGVKDTNSMQKTMATTLRLGTVCALITAVLAGVMPKLALSIFTSDPQVIELGARYLRILAFSYVPMFLIMNHATLLRNMAHSKIPMFTGIFSVAVNTLLNYVLIFGAFGLPSLGIEGAAIATVATRFLEMFLLMGICRLLKLSAIPTWHQIFVIDWRFSKVFFLTIYPVILNELIWVLGDSMYSIIYGHMGTAEMAAMTMTFPVQGMFIGFFTGLSSAAGIMIGNQLGAGEEEVAQRYAKDFVLLTLIGSVGMGVIIVSLSELYLMAYRVTPEVRTLSMQLLWVFGAVIWVKVSNMVIGNGVLRSGGETKFTFYMDLFGLWGIGVPLGFLSAFVLGFSVSGVYLMIALEELVRLGMGVHRLNGRKWIKNLTQTSVLEA
jgi:putative MATE family efflux protein